MYNDDPELSRLLQSWRHEPNSARRFNAEVWARVEAARDASWMLASAVGRWLGLPARGIRWVLPTAAAFMLALAMAAGAGAGHLQAAHLRADRMAAAYVKSIDPLQMTAEAAPVP